MKKKKVKLNEVTLSRLRAVYAEPPVRESDEVLFRTAATELPPRAPLFPSWMDVPMEAARPPVLLTLEREELAPFSLAAIRATEVELSAGWARKRAELETTETHISIDSVSANDHAPQRPTEDLENPAPLPVVATRAEPVRPEPPRRAPMPKRGLLVAMAAGFVVVAASFITVGRIEPRNVAFPEVGLPNLVMLDIELPSLQIPEFEIPAIPSLDVVAEHLDQAVRRQSAEESYQNGGS